MGVHLLLGLLVVASQPSETVDPQLDPVAATNEQPIIVTGEAEESEKGQRTVVVGSRIARKPVLEASGIASNTPVAAFSATSGVDPLSVENRVIKSKVSQCRSDNPAIGKEAACLLFDADVALQRQDRATAISFYRNLNASTEFSPAERLVAAEKLFSLGQNMADAHLREEALLRMLATMAMPAGEAQSARRSLVTLAIQRRNPALAIVRLREVVDHDTNDAQSFANLAVLLRQEGLAGSSDSMKKAIQIKQERGETIPAGWTDFVGGES
jgi:hypothetical protein